MLDLLDTAAFRASVDQAILLGALVSARVLPIVQLVPYLGGQAMPQQVKLGLTLALTVLVYPMVVSIDTLGGLPTGALAIALLLAKELAVGLLLGFVAILVFEAVRMAGQLVDTARGQTMAQAMVPQLKTQASVSATLLYQLSIVVFLFAGGHRVFLATLVRSFSRIPPQSLPAFGAALPDVAFVTMRLFADSIALGVLLAFPVIAAVFVTDLTLALINKAAPQINVFFLGMPLKALLGVAVLMLAIDVILSRFLVDAFGGLAQLDVLLQILEAAGRE